MRFLTSKDITKRIIIVIIFILLFSFTVPNYSQAAGNGGILLKPIAQLITGIGDLVMKVMQKVFLGNAIINDDNDNVEDREYYYYYTPYNIFAGYIPTFDINIFNPKDETMYLESHLEREAERVELNEIYDKLGITQNSFDLTWETYTITVKDENSEKILNLEYSYNGTVTNFTMLYGGTAKIDVKQGNTVEKTISYTKENSCNTADIAKSDATTQAINDLKDYIINTYPLTTQTNNHEEILSKMTYGKINAKNINGKTVYKVKGEETSVAGTAFNHPDYYMVYSSEVTMGQTVTKDSSAKILQIVISTWYKNFRIIALAGLLSVLVYVAIRIVLSSTGEDEAKYKKMLVDWVVAICLIFILQYIMIFILEISDKIIEIVVGTDSTIKTDTLFGDIRSKVAGDVTFLNTFGELIMYIVLVVYTVMFTVIYIKRVIYMGFLTAIAPLVALTYPLDKIKDGKAQAFSTWIKEYIFNALLPVMHILLYIILVRDVAALVTENWLYGIIAIGFLLPAEKFFRKMFGFEKAETIGKASLAAAGAAASKLMSKIASKGRESGEKIVQKATKPGMKTKDNKLSGGNTQNAPKEDSFEGKAGEKVGKETGGAVGQGTGEALGTGIGAIGGGIVGSVVPGAGTAAGAQEGAQALSKAFGSAGREMGERFGGAMGKTIGNQIGNVRKKAIRSAKLLMKKKFTHRKVAKYLGKKALRIGAGATLGTIGLAAGIATGDPGKALSFGLGGVAAGKALGNNVADKIESSTDKAISDVDTFMQGYEGTGYQQKLNKKLDEQFMKNPENQLFYLNQFGDNYQQVMQDALLVRDNGITQNDQIAEILKMSYDMNPNAQGKEKNSNIAKMVNIAQLSSTISDEDFSKVENRKQFKKSLEKKLVNQNLSEQQAKDNSEKMMELLAKFKNNNIKKGK